MQYSPNSTAAYLQGKIDEYVKQQARDTIEQNVRKDKYARYARIPDGNACDFCKMLGSRGFVYHSEESAALEGSLFDKYHPFCNCQIAVAFSPQLQKYWKNRVKVSRGYADDAELVRTGYKGDEVLRKVDIDELYDEYRKIGKQFTSGSRYRDYMTGEKASRLTNDKFAEYQEMLDSATDVDELHEIGDRIVKEWKPGKGGRDKKQWHQLSAYAQRLEKQLQAQEARPLASMPFKKASTMQEATERVSAYVDTSAYKSKVDIKGMDIDAANSLLKSLDAVYGSYDVEKLHSIQRMNKRSNMFRDTQAEAAYQWLIGDLFYNADFVKTKKAMLAHRAEGKALTEQVLGGDIDAYIAKNAGNSAKVKYATALRDTKRALVAQSYDNFEEVAYAHELGHMLDDKVFRKVKGFDKAASREKYAGGISAYATSSSNEYIAESFSAFYVGETEILDPALVRIFEEAMS